MHLYFTSPALRKPEFRLQVVQEKGTLLLEDSQLLRPRGFSLAEMRPGDRILVTNHPRRSWFARITCTAPSTYEVQ